MPLCQLISKQKAKMAKRKTSKKGAAEKAPEQTPQETLKFDLYIDAIGDGASRSRGIIALLMTATLVAVLGMFNSVRKEHNWFSSRIDALHKVYDWVLFQDDLPQKVLAFDASEKIEGLEYTIAGSKGNINNIASNKAKSILFYNNAFSWNEFRTILERNGKRHGLLAKDMPPHLRFKFPDYVIKVDGRLDWTMVDTEYLGKILTTAQGLSYTSRKEMESVLLHFDRARIENALLVRMPILGVTFDVNWLSLVSAATFSILLFLLYYSLSRERKNLFLVFKLAQIRKVDRLEFYQMLSMRQVLNVPRSIDQFLFKDSKELPDNRWDKAVRWLTNHLARYPLYTPAIAWGLIITHDYRTLDLGRATNESLTNFSFAISVLGGMVMLLLVFLCWAEWSKIIDIWEKESEEIVKIYKDK